MSSDYDFKYRLRVSFDEPSDVLAFINHLDMWEKGCDEKHDFHPALVQGGEDYLCLVETEGTHFRTDDDVELHNYGCEYSVDVLCDFIREIQINIPGVSIDGYITVIKDAQEVEFIFFRKSNLIDSLSDDDLAEMYEKDLGILATMEE